MNMRWKWIFLAPLAILGMLVFIVVGGEIVLLLWNWLLPPLFGWRVITFWQALGLLALCRILFGGLGWHRSGRSSFRSRMRDRCGHNLTPEERERFRERFRQRMRERFGMGPATGESKGPSSYSSS
jgi:hypothetical protein